MKKHTLLMTTTIIAGMMAFSTASHSEITADNNTGKYTDRHNAPSYEIKNNSFWWPDQLDLSPLRAHSAESNPYGKDFDYAAAFSTLDLAAVKKDIETALTTSQDWWPADYGNYGPFFIRMAWHSAGTYRTIDGRGGGDGGQMRFDPLNSWPDNANLDKARRLLWPIKQKYGRSLSWADLMILTGNVSLENMGFKTYGFAGGRTDDWEPDLVYWGPEAEMLASERHGKDGKAGNKGDLQRPLGATHMGLIYVNPEGPKSNHDPVSAAKAIREAFGRMAMNDEETLALIAGGHTFGKVHGAHNPKKCVGPDPAAAPTEAQGFGWKNKCGKGNAEDTTTSGLEGAWTAAPIQWTTMYLSNLLNLEWEKTKSPAGAVQWIPTDTSTHDTVPDAHVDGEFHAPIMLTTDIALKRDPAYRKIAERFLENPDDYQQAFAKAWFKLTHRDMGPRSRYLGTDVPKDMLIWQDPLPVADYELFNDEQLEQLKKDFLHSSSTSDIGNLVELAWASAASYRASDLRGGTDGGRVLLEPQKSWDINTHKDVNYALNAINTLRDLELDVVDDKNISMADAIVLAAAGAIEKASSIDVSVPFIAGRVDATQEQTDVASFALLEPTADAFRNYYDADRNDRSPVELMVEQAAQLNLTVPEMTVLIGGMRALGATAGGVRHGVLTETPGILNNSFFVNLLDMNTKWEKTDTANVYAGIHRKSGTQKWTATSVDLVFGSNAELRAIAEVYAADDGNEKFVKDFVKAWTKVMNLGRYKDGKKL